MKPLNAVPKTAKILSIIVAAILLLLPFHAFLTIWLSSGLGHYTLWRLWKEALLVPVFVGTVYILAISPGLRRKLFASWLTRLIAIYTALLFICGFVALARHAVTGEALAYGLLVDLRFLIFFLMVLVIAACSSFLSRNWRALLLLPATLVIIFGLLQYWLLPYDFLKHFGYGPATISPYETINHNIHRLRIESTLRGANPLGAYLVLIISAALSLLTAAKAKRPSQYAWLGGALLALVFSYSRSAWIGTFLSAAIILWLALKTHRARKIALLAAGAVIIAGGVAALALRHNLAFEDAFLHTDDQSQAAQSSNQGHSTAFKNGARDILHQPLGGGAGTAGPASAYNNHPGRLAENYFLQIGQEAGVAGIALFIAINIIVGRLLWLKRAQPLALALLASLIGLTFVNMLSHAWTDDTLSYIWWGLGQLASALVYLSIRVIKMAKRKFAQKHKYIVQFIEYMISGGAYFWVGYGAFAFFWSGLHWSLWWATITSNVIGWSVNYAMQRYWVFASKNLKGQQTRVTSRYIIITLVDFVLNYLILYSLRQVGITPYIGQFVSSGFFTVWNYLWYRFWVFPEPMKKQKTKITPARIVAHRAHGHLAYRKT